MFQSAQRHLSFGVLNEETCTRLNCCDIHLIGSVNAAHVYVIFATIFIVPFASVLLHEDTEFAINQMNIMTA